MAVGITRPSLKSGGNELFDEAYIDHSSVGDYSEVFPSVIGPQEAGRDIRLSVTYDF